MTLGCDTAAVLMSALDLLRHQTSPAQHALLTPDERRTSLHQLTVAVEAAAKLAEVAHVEAVAVAAQQKAAGVDADRIRAEAERFRAEAEKFRAEAEKFSKEAEKVTAETERTRGEAGKSRSEPERQATATEAEAAAAAAACTKPLETTGVPPSPAIAAQTTPGSSASPPHSESPPGSGTAVIALCTNHIEMTHIMDKLAEWNKNNIEQYTPAGWAWFRHSETEAFIFLDSPGDGMLSASKKIVDRTGTIAVPGNMRKFKQRGYDELIYGRRRGNGKRDSVLFF